MSKLQLKAQNVIMLLVIFFAPFYFIKFKYGFISLNLIEISILILCLAWIFGKEKKIQLPTTNYQLPVILILSGLILSIIVNKNYYVGLGILKGWFVLPILFAVIFLDSLRKKEKLLKQSLLALFWSGALVSLVGVYFWLTSLLTYDGRLRLFFDSPNQLAMFLGPIFLIGLFLGLKEKNSWKKCLFGIGTIFVAFCLYQTFSFGAWLSAAISAAALFWRGYINPINRKVVFYLLVILALSVIFVAKIKIESIRNEGGRSSLASREMIWKSAALMVKKNPVFGIGPGNFQNEYLEYQKYFSPYLEWAVPHPHNLFLAFWLEAGVLGLAGFILLIFQFWRDNKKAIENNRLYGSLCSAVVLYFLIHGLIDTTYWRNDLALLFWIMLTTNFFLASEATKKNDRPSSV